MQESYTDIPTLQAQRIALRLMKHWQHKFEVASTEQNIQIHMPNAMVEMIPMDQHLRVQIRAQQEDVARPGLLDGDVGLGIVRDAQRPHDDVAVGRGTRPAGVDPRLVEAMVVGDLVQPTVAQPVEPAVADMEDDGRGQARGQPEADDRRAHPAVFRQSALVVEAHDALVRPVDRGADDLDRSLGLRPVEPVRHRLVLEDEVVHSLDRRAAGDIAPDMAAHAVGDEDEDEIRIDLERVLVLGADPADIREAGILN